MSRTFEEQQLDNIRKDLDQMAKDVSKVVVSLSNINVGLQRLADAKCPVGDSDAGCDNEKPEDVENTYKRLVSNHTKNSVKPERDKVAITIAVKHLYEDDDYDSLQIAHLLGISLGEVRDILTSKN